MKKLARTSLCAGLGRAIKIAATSLRTKRSPAELLEQSEFQYQRRRFLKQAGSAALAASSLPILTNCAAKRLGSSGIEPRIVIVGAGLAGCTAAYYLTQAGFAPTIYEGSKRIGGRTFTLRNQFGPGLCTELGGEFIDSTHLDTLAFVKKFGFSLLDTRDPAEKHLHAQYYFDGQIYSDQDLVREITPVLKALARDVAVLAESQEAEAKFDRISISEYLRSRHVSGWLKKLLEVAYLTEYGLECDQQSSLNLLYLIATEINDSKFELFGESDERYKISGGNDQLAQALFEASGATAISDHRLEAVEKSWSDFRLHFRDGNRQSKVVAADILLLTIPFSVLRGVELRIDLPPKKLKAINELAYGANTKLIAGFNSRPWRNQSYSGDAFSDLGAQLCWDSGRFQAGDQSSLTVYLGGKLSLQAGAGSSRERVKQELPALDKLFPGTSAEFNDRIVRMHWPEKEFSLGSYSAYRVGQWTDIAGAEGEPCGDLFFAGEHCSRDFQGYMNGAVESGRIAAEAIAQRVLAVKFGHQEAI